MSKLGNLKIVRNLFLEKEELNRWEEFLLSKFETYLLKNTASWGVIGGDDAFRVSYGTNPQTIKTVEDSFAITDDGNFIFFPTTDNIDCSGLTDSLWYWLKIAYNTTNYEDGTVNVDINGNISGLGTSFLTVLRGQSAKAPSRISLYENSVKLGDYEVIDVGSNTTAIINSSFAVGKNGLKYAVTGTFTLGESIQEWNKNIFVYDSCTMSFVLETVTDTAPAGLDADKEFYVARIRNVSGTLTIQDKRTNYTYQSNGEYDASDALKISQNLNDVGSKSTSRTNLDVYSKAESSTLWDTKWDAEKAIDQFGADAISGNWQFSGFTKYLFIKGNSTATDPGITPGDVYPTAFIQTIDDGANKRVGLVVQAANDTAGFRHLVFIKTGGEICATITQLDAGGLSYTGVRKTQYVNAFNSEIGSIEESTLDGGGAVEYRGEVSEEDNTIGIDTVSGDCDFDTVVIDDIRIKRYGSKIAYLYFTVAATVKALTPSNLGLTFKLDKTIDAALNTPIVIMGIKEGRIVAGSPNFPFTRSCRFIITDGSTIVVQSVDNEEMSAGEIYYFQFSSLIPLDNEYTALAT